MERISLVLLISCAVAALVQASPGDLHLNSICSQARRINSKCSNNEFRCLNGKCIKREWYCDNGNDCGDNSDEYYCNYRTECPRFMKKCANTNRCIPIEWVCNGIHNCPNGDDENTCELNDLPFRQLNAKRRALSWLSYEKIERNKLFSSLDKVAVAFHLVSNMSVVDHRKIREQLSYGVTIQILSRLLKRKLENVSSTDLASYVNALIVTCLDPRKFHGLDLVKELRSRVEGQNYTNPYVFLSLCNAGEFLTEMDTTRIIEAFWAKHRIFWTDVQAVAVMALVCSSRQLGSTVRSETLHELMAELKQHQYRNGTIETLQTTALVLQAIISMESDVKSGDFDEVKALQQILSMEIGGGSFGNFQNNYYVMPVLNCKTLVDIGRDQCEETDENGYNALEDLFHTDGPKIRVRYSIWIGNNRDLEKNLVLSVPANSSFYEVMEWASKIEEPYRFEYTVKNHKPYVNILSEFQNDPETGKYWFIYSVVQEEPTLSAESPADIFPKNNEHIVMWYRKGSWVV